MFVVLLSIIIIITYYVILLCLYFVFALCLLRVVLRFYFYVLTMFIILRIHFICFIYLDQKTQAQPHLHGTTYTDAMSLLPLLTSFLHLHWSHAQPFFSSLLHETMTFHPTCFSTCYTEPCLYSCTRPLPSYPSPICVSLFPFLPCIDTFHSPLTETPHQTHLPAAPPFPPFTPCLFTHPLSFHPGSPIEG